MSTRYRSDNPAPYGYMLLALKHEIANSGTANLFSLKIELKGSRMILCARTSRGIQRAAIDIAKPLANRDLFFD